MKSAALITLEYPPQIGGIAEYLARLAADLPPGRVHILAQEAGDTHAADVEAAVPIYRRELVAPRLRPRWLPTVYWTDWLCRKEDIGALIVSHLLPIGHAAYALKLAKKLPYIVCTHGMDVALALSQGERKRAEAKRILGAAAQVVANSPYTANLVAGLGVPAERIMIVRPSPSLPVSTTVSETAVHALRDRYGLGADFTVLSVGRLVARKDFATVIEAVAALKWQGTFVRHLIVGDGPERSALEALGARLGVTDRIHFAGEVAAADLPTVYAACDLFVMVPKGLGPDVEGFGTVYLEAGLMGKPVIGSRSGGVPDAVCHGDTGLLIDPGDIKGLAAAIARFRDDPELCARMGAAGRARVLSDFAPGVQTRPFVSALEELLNGRS